MFRLLCWPRNSGYVHAARSLVSFHLLSLPLLKPIHSRRPVASALAMKIISAVQMEGGGEHVSDDEAHAAVEMATEALSQRIIAAVDEISNPKASAPKATKQLAARMAKVIVEAATSKADASSSAPRTSAFTNQHGEEWQLTVDAKGQKGILAGDETDWETLQITGDAVQSDFMFSKEELVWLRKAWKAATGRELKHPTMNVEQLLVQAGLLHKISPAPKRAATKKK